MRLDDALQALGEDGLDERRTAEICLADIVGTVNRLNDFDQEFRLINANLRARWQRLACSVAAGFEPPPVELIQLDALYFVVDGHHRISVARSLGRTNIRARIQRICTVAYATCCLRLAHLPSKTAERRFLERVPLSRQVRQGLWLNDPAAWMRLADSAEAWAFRQSLNGRTMTDRCELAGVWWNEEVVPVLKALRTAGVGTDLPDVQLYTTALAVHDRLICEEWPAGTVDHLRHGSVTRRVQRISL